jgi:hypothetical protein
LSDVAAARQVYTISGPIFSAAKRDVVDDLIEQEEAKWMRIKF